MWFDPWVGKIPWRRKWQPAPVFLPGKSHRQRSPVGYRPWGHKEWDMTQRLNNKNMTGNWLNPSLRNHEFRIPTMGPEHPWILVPMEGPKAHRLWLLRDDCRRCYHWKQLGQRCRSPFCTISAVPYKSITTLKQKKKQTRTWMLGDGPNSLASWAVPHELGAVYSWVPWPWPVLLLYYLLPSTPTYSFTVISMRPIAWRTKLLGSARYVGMA